MICTVDDSGYCARHRRVHKGRLLQLALEPGELGEKYRRIWDTEVLPRCANLGKLVGHANCKPCSEKAGKPTAIPLHECKAYGKCTIAVPVAGFHCCAGGIVGGTLVPCAAYEAPAPAPAPVTPTLRWSYGVTTVPSRRDTLLPKTLASLAAGGFSDPHLFVDGAGDYAAYKRVTQRSSPVLVHGNWALALYELYIREPTADRYAVFQDDVIVYKNLRQYLEKCKYPDMGYLNLYTEPRNEAFVPTTVGWHQSNQRGLGALALVFSRRAVLQLLVSDTFAMKPIPATPTEAAAHAQGLLYRGQKTVDGAVVTAFAQAGWKEYVHRPTLVQHTGKVSSFSGLEHPPATGFLGETYDALRF